MSRVPVMRVGPAGAPVEEEPPQQLRSKGLLPALGVGGAIYLISGVMSLGTLALIGVGAGVGYGVGSWLSEQYERKQDGRGALHLQDLPEPVRVSLSQWQVFLASKTAGQPASQTQIDAFFLEFAQLEPMHAQNVQFAQSRAAQGAGEAASRRVLAAPGVTIVPTVPTVNEV